jgi:hypothetical protein
MATVEAIARVEFDSEDLSRRHPPRFHNDKKRMLFEKISVPIRGLMAVTRWRGQLPALVKASNRPELRMREDIFTYPDEDPETTAWHLNFADAELFGYYGGALLAQDEHQVLEHPILGSLREALLDVQQSRLELAPRTREDTPTPYLIKGVQRSLSFDTITGPYGNAFAAAAPVRILRAATFLESPTFSNILAMEAPPGGHGRYSREQIRAILETAFIGFSACKAESTPSRTLVNTGNWGCGAFGGNPALMAFLQLCAAQLAGIDCVVFHTFSPRFSESYGQALGLLDELVTGPDIDTNDLIDKLHAGGFEWGQSDGN